MEKWVVEKIQGFIEEGRKVRGTTKECDFCLFRGREEVASFFEGDYCLVCILLFPGLADAFGRFFNDCDPWMEISCPCNVFPKDFVVWRIEKFMKEGI